MASGTRAETVSTWPAGATAQRRVSGCSTKMPKRVLWTLPLSTNSLGNRDRAEPRATGHAAGRWGGAAGGDGAERFPKDSALSGACALLSSPEVPGFFLPDVPEHRSQSLLVVAMRVGPGSCCRRPLSPVPRPHTPPRFMGGCPVGVSGVVSPAGHHFSFFA